MKKKEDTNINTIKENYLITALIIVAIWGASLYFFYIFHFGLFFTDIFLIIVPIIIYWYKRNRVKKEELNLVEEEIGFLLLIQAVIIDYFYYIFIFVLGYILCVLTIRLWDVPKIILTALITLFVYKQYFTPSKGYKYCKICFNKFEPIVLITNYLYFIWLLLFLQPLLFLKIIGILFCLVEMTFIISTKNSMLIHLFKIKRYKYREVEAKYQKNKKSS